MRLVDMDSWSPRPYGPFPYAALVDRPVTLVDARSALAGRPIDRIVHAIMLVPRGHVYLEHPKQPGGVRVRLFDTIKRGYGGTYRGPAYTHRATGRTYEGDYIDLNCSRLVDAYNVTRTITHEFGHRAQHCLGLLRNREWKEVVAEAHVKRPSNDLLMRYPASFKVEYRRRGEYFAEGYYLYAHRRGELVRSFPGVHDYMRDRVFRA